MKEKNSHARRVHQHDRLLLGLAIAGAAALIFVVAVSANAASGTVGSSPPDLSTVIDRIRLWAVGILAALATLMLTIGGIRYIAAAGNPRSVEEAKGTIRAALIGYAMAALAPLLFGIVQKVVG